jgi:urease accessory protein
MSLDRPPSALPRARGAASLVLRAARGRTVVVDLGQSGCARLRFPRSRHEAVEGVLINTAGGMTDGDRICVEVLGGPGTALTLTSQAAEKIYRSRGAPAELRATLRLGTGAAVAWLPQETILFDGARLVRRMSADLDHGARLLACESLVFGRRARGETVRRGLVHDAWRVSRDGRLLWADAFRLEGDIEAQVARPAVLDGRHALASAVYVGEDAGRWLEPTRAWLDRPGIRAGVSLRPGVLVMRVMAEVGQALRRALAVMLAPLRAAIGAGPAELPRVWAC